METNNNRDERHLSDDRHHSQNPEKEQILNDDGYTALENASKDRTINDRREGDSDKNPHHQAHGIRNYESFTNHSSADDQPMTDTGA